MTPDDVVTRLYEARTPVEPALVLAAVPVPLLREVADLLYAVDDPEAHGRQVLTRKILEAL